MYIKFSLCALLCAALVAQTAVAGQGIDPNVVPALRLGVTFGGAAARSTPFDLALQLQYRGVFTQQVLDSQPGERLQLTPLSVEMIRLSGSRSGVRSAYVFSHDLLRDDSRLNEADWRSDGIPRWVWWTIGGVAVTAAALAGAGGGGSDSDNDFGSTDNPGGDPGPQDCNIVGVHNGTVDVISGCSFP